MSQTSDPGDAESPPGTDAGPPTRPPPAATSRRVPLVVAGVVVLLLAVGGTAFLLTRGDGGGGDAASGKPTAFERRVERARSEDPDDIEVPDAERPGDLGDDVLLDRYADECFDGDISSCDDLFRESFLGSGYEKYGSSCGERTKRGQAGACTALYPDPDYEDLRRQCSSGDDRACDELYTDSPQDSIDEHFGSTCGGRSDDELAGSCEEKA